MQAEIDFGDKPDKVKRFERFHMKHPRVYREFKRKALKVFGRKPTRVVSGRMIFESVRYDIYIMQDDEELYKMNNNYCPAYIRMFEKEFPRYAGLMPTKESIFDSWI